MAEKKVVDEDILLKYEMLTQEINRVKEENNSLKLKIRDLEESSQSKKLESMKKMINGLYNIIENLNYSHFSDFQLYYTVH